MNNNHQQSDEIQERLLQKTKEKKRKKMKVSGKSVFEIQKQIYKRIDDNYTNNERTMNRNN